MYEDEEEKRVFNIHVPMPWKRKILNKILNVIHISLTLLSIFSLPFQITFSVILRIQGALSVVFVSYMPEIMILAAGSTRQLTTTSGACLQNRKWVNFRKLKVLIRAVVGVHMPSKMMSKKLVKSRRRLNSTIWLVCRSIFTRSCFLRLIWTKTT